MLDVCQLEESLWKLMLQFFCMYFYYSCINLYFGYMIPKRVLLCFAVKWSVWLLEMTGGDWPPVMKGIISSLFSSQCSIIGHIGFYSWKVFFLLACYVILEP